MIDIGSESLLSLPEAALLLPPGRRGRPAHFSCILRWITHGARTPTGERVRLSAARVGGRWVTSREALQRFAQSLTPRLDGEPAPTPRSAAARRRASERAAKVLERVGI